MPSFVMTVAAHKICGEKRMLQKKKAAAMEAVGKTNLTGRCLRNAFLMSYFFINNYAGLKPTILDSGSNRNDELSHNHLIGNDSID